MPDAPHLPSRTITEQQKHQWQRLSWFLFIVIISFFVGAVGAIIMSSWLIPQQVAPHTAIYNVGGGKAAISSATVLDALVLQQTEQRLLRVYDRSQKVDGLYKESGFLGQAVVLSAGGWAVLYDTNLQSINYQNWEFVDFEGQVFRAEKAIADKQHPGLFFVKVEGTDFRGDIIFPDWKNIQGDDVLAAVTKDTIVPVAISDVTPYIPTDSQYRVADLAYEYDLLGDVAVGDIVITHSGELVGFVSANNTLIGGWYVQTQLVSLFTTGSPWYGELALRGFLVDRASGVHPGFYVNQVLPSAQDVIQKGDVIIKVQDRFLDDPDIERIMATLLSDVPITILRSGEQIQLILKKQVI